MSTSIVLTVVCDDRPGIVEGLSQLLGDHHGNWAESSMMSLAGKFAGILLLRLPSTRVDAFMAALERLEADGMQIVAQRCGSAGSGTPARVYSLELVGQDHPGIVHDITDLLARRGVNVQELETSVQSASMSGESLFLAHAEIHVPEEVPMEELQQELEDLANELMVDIRLED